MKIISILMLVCTLSLNALAQPNYFLKTYRVKDGQKANQYNREAKKFIKSGQYNEAAMNAAYALKIAIKKGHISTAQEYLNASYNRSVQANLNRIEVLEEDTETFAGDQTVTELAEIIRLYKTMRATDNILKEVPPKSFHKAKKKDPGFTPEYGDYKSIIATTRARLATAKEEAAKMHYAEARKLESQEGKLNSKMAAKKYRWAYEYVPDYRDAKDRYAEVKKLGTTRMGLMKFESSGSQYGDFGAILSDKLLTFLSSKASELDFFEVIDRNKLDVVINEQQLALSGLMDESTTANVGELKGVDVLLVGNVTKAIVDRQRLDPVNRNYEASVVIRTEKYTDEKGKKKTRKIYGKVFASATVREKKAEATIGGSYKIIDVQTGVILDSGTASGANEWHGRWMTNASGDERALPSLNTTEPKYPGYNRMLSQSSNTAALQIYKQILNYAVEVGK
ncbi:MAG: CsgG/HfaB family protein [Cyclobacteriaceae bacterium]|nr:CsgG/HfaB family protein [Cyclobacteriaceae bacterium]